jgi:alkyl hydroperoxide reductase subunit AhpF
MAKLLDADIQKQVQKVFQGLKEPVHILYFGSKGDDCEYCEQTAELLAEVVALSPKLSLTVYDLQEQAELAARLNIDKVPAFALVGPQGEEWIDYGIRYAGIPAGHEFGSLMNSLLLVSNRDSGLSPVAREFLAQLQKPVHLQVFITPT